MSRWSFRFLLWYICVMFVQPQNRFPFLWPYRIANVCILTALALHVLSAMVEKRPIIKFGPATITALILFVAGMASQYGGVLQVSTGWNGYIDILAKNCIALVLTEATCLSIERVWAVQGTMMLASLWWVKAGLRLSGAGATHAGDRIMGPTVGLVDNPNSFAYMMCVMIPIYLYFYQQSKQKYLRAFFLFLTFASVFIIFETGSRTGFLALAVLSIFLLPKYGRQHKATLIIAGIAMVFLMPLVSPGNVERLKSIPESFRAFLKGETKELDELTQDEQSAQERRLKNQDTWKLIKDYPIFGVGMNVPDHMIVGNYPMATGQVHCEILMAGRQMGVIGMGLYIAFLVILFRHGWRVQKHTAGWWPQVADLGWTFKMQTVVFIVGGAFSPLPWNAPEMILVGAVSALWTNVRSLTVDSFGEVGSDVFTEEATRDS